jgi:hypothetical protein
MQKKSDLWIILAVVVGIILGYVLRGTNFNPEDQTAGTRSITNRNIVTFNSDGSCTVTYIDTTTSIGYAVGQAPHLQCLVGFEADGSRAVANRQNQ